MADAVHRPDADDRSYRIVDLPNDLRVLLISDPRISAPKEPPARTAGSFLSWCSPRQPVTIVEPALAGDSDDDSTNRMAACALCVGVGYLADPAHLGGCAHYVEHMAFMGTREYPEENGWSKFLSRHGGDSNAETDAETTVFYFDVHPAHLVPRFVASAPSSRALSSSGAARGARCRLSTKSLSRRPRTTPCASGRS